MATNGEIDQSSSMSIADLCKQVSKMDNLKTIIKEMIMMSHSKSKSKSTSNSSSNAKKAGENNVTLKNDNFPTENFDVITDFIAGQINLYSTHVNSGKNAVCFNREVTQTAINIFTRSKAAYTALQDAGLVLLQSVSTLKKYINTTSVHEGHNFSV
jgi:hypothetical protein